MTWPEIGKPLARSQDAYVPPRSGAFGSWPTTIMGRIGERVFGASMPSSSGKRSPQLRSHNPIISHQGPRTVRDARAGPNAAHAEQPDRARHHGLALRYRGLGATTRDGLSDDLTWSMATAPDIALNDWVELLEPIDAAPAGARGGVVDLLRRRRRDGRNHGTPSRRRPRPHRRRSALEASADRSIPSPVGASSARDSRERPRTSQSVLETSLRTAQAEDIDL